MNIAVPYENGGIFQHFGHTGQVKIYHVENGQVLSAQVVDTSGSGHGALAGFLSGQQVDVLICGGIGAGAQEALAQAGIKLYGGVSGEADRAVQAFLANSLDYNPMSAVIITDIMADMDLAVRISTAVLEAGAGASKS